MAGLILGLAFLTPALAAVEVVISPLVVEREVVGGGTRTFTGEIANPGGGEVAVSMDLARFRLSPEGRGELGEGGIEWSLAGRARVCGERQLILPAGASRG